MNSTRFDADGPYKIDPVFAGLRGELFRLSETRSAHDCLEGTDLLAALMEIGFDDFTVAVVAVADGAASIYLTSGQAIIGAGHFEVVSVAVQEFLKAATRFVPLALAVRAFPLPGKDKVRFYLVSPGRIQSVQASVQELVENVHAFAELFHRGQDLISAIRVHAGESENETPQDGH